MATKTNAASRKSKPTTKSDRLAEAVDDAAKATIGTMKDAMPSMDDAAAVAGDMRDYVQDHANINFQQIADDATNFVRRNPGTSLAAAAGVGILIGILAAKRS